MFVMSENRCFYILVYNEPSNSQQMLRVLKKYRRSKVCRMFSLFNGTWSLLSARSRLAVDGVHEQWATTNNQTDNGGIAAKNGLCTCLLQRKRLENYVKLFCSAYLILLWIKRSAVDQNVCLICMKWNVEVKVKYLALFNELWQPSQGCSLFF